MFDQTFALSDIPRVFIVMFLEIILSADNAVVLGVLSHSLPKDERKKALFIGVFSSFILRAGALLAVAILLKYIWIQLLGGIYLLYLSIRYFVKKKNKFKIKPQRSFWKVVLLIEIMDLVFAMDSIVAGVAFIDGVLSKLWIVYFGGALGIFWMRYMAGVFSSLIDRFPKIEVSAYLIVGWIGLKLGLSAVQWEIPHLLFWAVFVILFLLGFYRKKEVN